MSISSPPRPAWETYLIGDRSHRHLSPRIGEVMKRYGENLPGAWEEAKHILGKSVWKFKANATLDDTADTSYSCLLPKEQAEKVVAGIYAKLVTSSYQEFHLAIRNVEDTPDGVRITMSAGSTHALKQAVPAMTVGRVEQSAGHAVTRLA